jgi:hypothetical protein
MRPLLASSIQVKYIKIGVLYLLIQSVLKDLLCKKEMNLEE